jgi:sugar phosphate isomerase/epimerase
LDWFLSVSVLKKVMRYLLHSVSYAGFWRGQKFLPLKKFLHKAADLGFDGVEIMGKRPHLSLLDMSDAEIEKIKSILKERKIECACIAGYTDFTAGLNEKMIPNWEIQLTYVFGLIKLAHELGCKIIRIFTGMELKQASFAEQWDLCVKGIRECCKEASKYGITIGIQNHHDIAVDAPTLKQLLKEINMTNCKAMFDAWAPSLQNLNLKDAIDEIKDALIFTTVADYIQVPRFHYEAHLVNYSRGTDRTVAVPMGEGIIDYTNFFKLIKDVGFDGYVSYEMCSELRDGGSEEILDKYARQFLEYMKKFQN